MKDVKVWDLAVRLFHWSLVAAFALAFVSGEKDWSVHDYAGYAVLGLVVFRIVWGFVGSQHARFSSFIASPGEVFRYLRSLLRGKPQHYLGHNPAGGWMVMALLALLFISGISGWQLDEAHAQPAATTATAMIEATEDNREATADHEHESEHRHSAAHDTWEEVHEVSTHVSLLLVFVHILGVLASSFLHRESLVKAMITGFKKHR